MLSREQKSGGGGNWSGSSHARQEEHKRWKERRLVGYKGVEGRKGERKTRYTYVSIRSRERDSHVCVCVCVIEPTQYHGTLSLGTLEVQLCTCFVPSCNYLQVTYLKGRVERERERVCVVVAPRGNMYEIRFRPFLLRVSLAATALPLIANVIGRSRAFHPSALPVPLPEMRTSRDASG